VCFLFYNLIFIEKYVIINYRKVKERKNTMAIAKNIRCPLYSLDCPYLCDGWCQMEEETGDHPADQCDEYMFANEEDEEDE
jgi:hypothetical protein